MRELVQSVSGGELRHVELPGVRTGPTSLLIATRSSLISSGTERSTHQLAGSSLLQKAKARPDLVRAVVDRAKSDGIRSTMDAVRSRLDEDMPVGYSAAGVVSGVGEAVSGFRTGDRVSTAGVGHAEVQLVPGNLAARLPDGVSFDEGAFGAIASVALHGLRLADVGPGSRVLVIGLGLIGQLAVRLALASGCEVAGTDVDTSKFEKASSSGAFVFPSTDAGYEAVLDWTSGRGADAVLVTAATKSSSPMRVASRLARDRATIVAVGDVGLDLDRRPLYEKELTIRVSRAYGPGRYDPVYEDLAIDYPVGFVRWPIGRNLEAVMSLIAAGRLEVKDLITHRYSFDRAIDAYDVFEGVEPYFGILLEYERGSEDHVPSIQLEGADPRIEAGAGLASGLVGAGRFASGVLLPFATTAGFGPWTSITSAGGASAVQVGGAHGFSEAVSSADDILESEDVRVVFVASRHDSHAEIAASALTANKHVFCEKPLALSEEELTQVIDAYNESNSQLMVGFNRRWSPAVMQAIDHVGTGSPLQVVYRIHAGSLPDDHWLKDRRQGGRLLGEGCHFIDTCNAVAGEIPRSVFAIGSGKGELLLQEDFTIALNYPSGSQATIVYSSGAPRGTGKERVEIMRGDRSAEIDDYRTLTLRSATKIEKVKYKPADKGHKAEFVVFREVIEGKRDGSELAMSAIQTSRVAFGAVESMMTGEAISLDWS